MLVSLCTQEQGKTTTGDLIATVRLAVDSSEILTFSELGLTSNSYYLYKDNMVLTGYDNSSTEMD